ncbi:MAG: hypothetical protein HY588_01160 [Candidatus Omnitrophica bacterium]|nr:hypothetical protein [Candidatus Omnitrophota bacterium]
MSRRLRGVWEMMQGVCFALLIFFMGCASPSNVGFLKGLAANEEQKAAVLQAETVRFQELKRAISDRKLKTEISQGEFERQFGKPVVVLQEGTREKYVYKSGKAGWFGGEKVYLYFDQQSKLVKWECVRFECQSA